MVNIGSTTIGSFFGLNGADNELYKVTAECSTIELRGTFPFSDVFFTRRGGWQGGSWGHGRHACSNRGESLWIRAQTAIDFGLTQILGKPLVRPVRPEKV